MGIGVDIDVNVNISLDKGDNEENMPEETPKAIYPMDDDGVTPISWYERTDSRYNIYGVVIETEDGTQHRLPDMEYRFTGDDAHGVFTDSMTEEQEVAQIKSWLEDSVAPLYEGGSKCGLNHCTYGA